MQQVTQSEQPHVAPLVRQRRSTVPTIAISLAGCDFGTSGIGVFARQVVPRIALRLERSGISTLMIGTRRERAALDVSVDSGMIVPDLFDSPGASAAFCMFLLPLVARTLGADLLYLPAANRRTSALPVLKLIGTVHDLAQFHVPNKYGAARQLYISRVLTPMLRKLDVVTAVSHATASDIVRFAGVPRSRILVIPNGVAVGTPADTVRPHPGPYLLYPARLEHPGKNHLRLIEAFATSKLRKTHDLILAGADWGAGDRIRELARRLGVTDRVVIAGFVSRDRLTHLMAGAEAVIAAGLFEGFGLQAAEALALGSAVAVSNTGSLPEVVGDLGVLFDPKRVSSIAEALERVVYDDSIRSRCRAEGPRRARRYSWEATADKITLALTEMLDGTA